jgi:5-methylcytosine-specific restriction enzyme A
MASVANGKWFNTRRWKRLRRLQLAKQPLCQQCLAQNIIKIANVVHHKEQHKGNYELFWHSELESVCEHCHNGKLQREEKNDVTYVLHADGWMDRIPKQRSGVPGGRKT